MNVGTNNHLVRSELVCVSEEVWFTPFHEQEGFPVFRYAGIPLCYAAYTAPELCAAAIEKDFPGCVVRQVANNGRFLAHCKGRGAELLMNLDTEKRTFAIICDGPAMSPGSDDLN